MRPSPRRCCCIRGRWWGVRSKERGARSKKKARSKKHEGNGEPAKETGCSEEGLGKTEAEAAYQTAEKWKLGSEAAQADKLTSISVLILHYSHSPTVSFRGAQRRGVCPPKDSLEQI